jgi:xylulokinase
MPHGRAHLARAVFEGITFGLRDNLELARELGVHVDHVLLAGGGARSAFWRQLCADVFNVPVHVARGDEGSALGAALLAGVGAGDWTSVDEAAEAATSATTTVVTPRDAGRYDAAYERFRAVYHELRPAFSRSAGTQ